MKKLEYRVKTQDMKENEIIEENYQGPHQQMKKWKKTIHVLGHKPLISYLIM